jgi:two-component system nitrate/nitrite response regulator NarL
MVGGFRALVAEPAGFVVSACREPEELRTRLAAEPADLVLIDVNCGITPDFLCDLKSLAPDSGLILWVDGISPEFVRQAIASGVRGVLRRDASIDLYVSCISEVTAGQLWLEEALSQRLLCAKAVRLSPRERELVTLLTQGLRNKEIAWRMNITEGTTKVYLSRLFEKTGAGDRFEIDPSFGALRGSACSSLAQH